MLRRSSLAPVFCGSDHGVMNHESPLHIDTPLGPLTALRFGNAASPPLLALHGWLDNAASFATMAPWLADHRYVVALDLPGHGHSAHLDERTRRYHFVDQIDHVLDAADALGMPQFDLLGHSLGAGIASMLAAVAPERVRRLALIEGLGPLADDGSQTLSRWCEARGQRDRARRKPRVFATLEDAVAARVMVGDLDADEVRPIVERNLRVVDGGFSWCSDARLRLKTPLRMAEGQVTRLLRGIEAPTLLLLADPPTPYLPTAGMQARATQVADIRVQHLAGPHHLHIRHPREVAGRVLEFLDGAPPVRG